MLKDLMALVLQYDHVVFKLLYLDKGEIFDLKNTLGGINKTTALSMGRGISRSIFLVMVLSVQKGHYCNCQARNVVLSLDFTNLEERKTKIQWSSRYLDIL